MLDLSAQEVLAFFDAYIAEGGENRTSLSTVAVGNEKKATLRREGAGDAGAPAAEDIVDLRVSSDGCRSTPFGRTARRRARRPRPDEPRFDGPRFDGRGRGRADRGRAGIAPAEARRGARGGGGGDDRNGSVLNL